MELIEGAISLKKLLDPSKNPFHANPLKSLKIFLQLVNVIIACESKGIVHRDISPSNLLILPDESIRVIDFGICQIDGHTPITLIDEGVGSINYMAPECESGAEGQISSKSDLYSAGKILWSAITSRKAFARESPVFTTHSMNSIFPDRAVTWHLNQVFEFTVRRNLDNRSSPENILHLAKNLYGAIASSRLPIELIPNLCSVCGIGKLGHFENHTAPFGSYVPKGVTWKQCSYCGCCFPVNEVLIQTKLARRKSLE